MFAHVHYWLMKISLLIMEGVNSAQTSWHLQNSSIAVKLSGRCISESGGGHKNVTV